MNSATPPLQPSPADSPSGDSRPQDSYHPISSDNYSDIIHLERPRPSARTPMTLEARAAQFAPFSALNGLDDAIRQTDIEVRLGFEDEENFDDF